MGKMFIDKNTTMTSRRNFIQTMAGATAALLLSEESKFNFTEKDIWGNILPKRKFGSTGESVTMLGVGGYHVGWTSEENAQQVIETAIKNGIRFFDTAESYSDGESERRYGKYLVPKYRDQIFLMSKSTATDDKKAMKHLEGTLSRLNTDHLDLWQIHALESPEDVDRRIKAGVLDVAIQAKKEGKIRHIGFTGHENPYAHLRMLERTKDQQIFSACQFPINAVDFASEHSFVRLVLPKAREMGLAVIAMKTLADGRFFKSKTMNSEEVWKTNDPVVPNRITIDSALSFAWTMPISVLVTGAENAAMLEEKVKLAGKYTKMDNATKEKIASKVADLAKEGKVEYYKKV